MIAKKFLKWALDEDYDLDEALQVLSKYMGKNSDFYRGKLKIERGF